jgi:hypothetical protein
LDFMQLDPSQIARSLATVQDRIDHAARRCGRSLADVTLLAVTKTVPPETVREARRCGVRLVGENRVQDAEEKKAVLSLDPFCGDLAWHLIGHLQTNKAKKAVALFDCVQSVDSLDLAERLDRLAAETGRTLRCLVEIKVSEEVSKFGLPPGRLDDFLDRAAEWPRLRIEGLMTIAPYFDEPERSRPYFRRVRELFEKRSGRFGPRPVLSMGMTHDFEVAVEEGSSMVRIGTAIFGERSRAAAAK